MLLEKVPEAFETFTGRLKDESHVPVAFNDPDKEDGETEAGVSVFDICINTVENQILGLFELFQNIFSSVGCISQHACSYMFQIFDRRQ